MNESLYDTLGVSNDATIEEIKEAYRNLAKIHHPDKEGGSHEKMEKLNKAYAVLKDERARKHYDETGEVDSMDFEKRFTAFAQDVFMRLVESHDVKSTDLIGAFENHMNKLLLGNKNAKKDFEKKLERFNFVLERLKSKNNHNPIRIVLESNIAHAKQTLKAIDNDTEFINQCKTRLKDYTYDFDKAESNRVFLSIGPFSYDEE